MAEKAEDDTTPEARKRRSRQRRAARVRTDMVPLFFPAGFPPEGRLFWEITRGIEFHSGRMQVLLKTLVRERALEIIGKPLFRWKLRGGWSAGYFIRWSKADNKFGEPVDRWRYRVLQHTRDLPVDPAPPEPPPSPELPTNPTKAKPKHYETILQHIARLYPEGADGISSGKIHNKFLKDKNIVAECGSLAEVWGKETIDRARGKRSTR